MVHRTFVKIPVQRRQCRLFHRVTHNCTIIQPDQCVRGSETQRRLARGLLDVHKFVMISGTDSTKSAKGIKFLRKTHSTPTMPSKTKFSAVIVPVLSKQHTSTRPANGIRNGSVQNMAI